MMIDRDRRKKLALHLRQLTTGQISNDDFEEKVMDDITKGWLPEQYYRSNDCKTDDRVIQSILEYSWMLYSDLKNHKLIGKYALPEDALKEITRYILFLHSDLEYEWKYVDMTNPIIKLTIKDLIKSIMTLGKHYKEIKVQREMDFEEMRKECDIEYWPFKTKTDYENQLEKQPYLIGNE